MRLCTVENCTRPLHTAKFCQTHYKRLTRTGSLHLVPRGRVGCEVDGCDREHASLGYCTLHYGRFKRIGSVALTPPRPLPDRLAEYDVDDNGCWIYRGRPDVRGYSRISVGNRLCYAHRISYELHVGPIPEGLTLDHLCRVTRCINPTHLEPVTRAENTRRQAAALKERTS